MEILVAVVVFAFTIFVNVLGAWVWSRAIADAHRAHSHGISVREQEALIRETHDAVDEVREEKKKRSTPPTDDDLRDIIRAEREYYTDDNAERDGYEGAAQPDSLYVTVGEDG